MCRCMWTKYFMWSFHRHRCRRPNRWEFRLRSNRKQNRIKNYFVCDSNQKSQMNHVIEFNASCFCCSVRFSLSISAAKEECFLSRLNGCKSEVRSKTKQTKRDEKNWLKKTVVCFTSFSSTCTIFHCIVVHLLSLSHFFRLSFACYSIVHLIIINNRKSHYNEEPLENSMDSDAFVFVQ